MRRWYRNIAKECDDIIMASIFLIVLVYGIQWLVVTKGWMNPRRAFELFTMFEVLVLSFTQVWKAWRFRACSLTWTATILYVCMVLTSIVYIIWPFGFETLMTIGIWMFTIGSTCIVIAYVIRERLRYLKKKREWIGQQ